MVSPIDVDRQHSAACSGLMSGHLSLLPSSAVQPGHHTFRFLINAAPQDNNLYEPMAHLVSGPPQYCVLNHLPLETLPSGAQVNSLRVPAPPVFKLMFHTLCSEAWIFYRYKGQEVSRLGKAQATVAAGSFSSSSSGKVEQQYCC